MLRIDWTFEDASSLRSAVEKEVLHGRAFVPGAIVAGAGAALERAPCELALALGAHVHVLGGEVVFVREAESGGGIGVALAPLDDEAKAALRAFVDGADGADGAASEEGAAVGPPAEGADGPDCVEGAAGTDGADADADEAEAHGELARLEVTMFDRLRKLSSVDQQKMAAAGTLAERTALERMYGPNVWETLIKNPRITAPEIARIAKKGTVPRPLLELIGGNGAWLAVGEVQRALLANPRTSSTVVSKILATLPKHDLARVPQQSAYPAAVRSAAKRMLGGV